MAEFSNLGDFEKTSKPNDEFGEKQGFGCQSLTNEVGLQLEVQNDAIPKENHGGVEVQLCNNDLGSIGNVVDEAVRMSNVISDGISLEGLGVSLDFDHMLENRGEGGGVSVQGEQLGGGIFLDGMDVSLDFQHASNNQVDGAHGSVQGEQSVDVVHTEGGDVGLVSEDMSRNQVEGAHVNVGSEETRDSVSMEGGHVGLKSEDVSGNQVEDAHVSVQSEEPRDCVSMEGGDVDLKSENMSGNQVEGSHVSVQCEEPRDGISMDGGDVGLKSEDVSGNQVEGAHVSVQSEEPRNGISLERGDVGLKSEDVSGNQVEGAHVSVQSEEPRDGISMEGEDVGLKYDDVSGNQVEDAHVCVQSDEPKDGISMEGEDVILNVEFTSEDKVECVHVSVEGEQPGGDVSLQGEDASLKCENVSVIQGEGTHPIVQGEEPQWKENADSEAGLDNLKVKQNVEIKDEQVEKLHNDVSMNYDKIEENERVDCDTQVVPNAQSTPPPQETGDKVRVVVLASPAVDGSEIPRRGRKPGKAEAKSSVDNTRALRTRSKVDSESPEPNVNMETTKGSTGRRGRKKGKENDGKPANEFSRMKKHLKYLLHRIHYEQNLLDAYSSEGWRGQSVEKLRPEKELQRAKADINCSKLKIRNLFQKIDSISAEGKFPESLYDSEGLIDSEDIFCAKCGSKDLPVGNDIILCDGICERGFHQYCLDPPLRTEEIPPGDEGWLCPACDCKHDCVDLINDSQGTKLCIEDSWEKVFPEAVAAMSGKELDDVAGLPSDDSEDNEYNPDGTDDDANVEGNESKSDQSDSDESDSSEFSSASEDLGAICGAEQNLGLPSDDSEDDDFDPDAKNINEEGIEHESSSSDFTSASEDLGAAIVDDGALGKDEPPLPMELDQEFGESSPITSKRCVERLDYKKLFDETYGNAASDSSDDEEWTDMVPTRKRKSSTEKSVSASADGACGSGAPRRRSRAKTNLQVANGSPGRPQESCPKTSSGGTGKKRPPYNRLGEAVTQRLYAAFKENQYPDREAKEKLANELGLTAHRVDKWFGNARWSFNHHPSRVEASMSRVVSQSNTNSCNGGESDLASNAVAFPGSGSSGTSKLNSASPKSTPRNSRKKDKVVDKPTSETKNTENSKEDTQTDQLQTPDAPQGRGQRQRKRRKAGA